MKRFFMFNKAKNYILVGLTLEDTKRIFLEWFNTPPVSFDVFEWNENMDTLELNPEHAVTSKFSIYNDSYVVYDGK